MCGIAGYINLVSGEPIHRDTLVRMADSLLHRGPDAAGYYQGQQAGFGFRRLSIMDLEGGHQPMYSADRSTVMVCNGEVFNYPELRVELESKGHRFRTKCDVEVILYLYEQYGLELMEHLNGQFAFAIYDENRRRLLIARDPVGILPLYYTVVVGQLVFGSEIKAILKHEAVRPEVDLTGLDQVLSLPGIVSPTSMFKGIKSLPPGHYLLVENGEIRVKQYWDLEYPQLDESLENHPESYYTEGLKERLTRSIQRRLQADVPVGLYLSGGLDSSLLAAILHELIDSGTRHSFSIGFEEKQISEVKYQKIMAELIHSRHHETLFCWPEIAARFREMIYHCETPVKETYNTCSLALAEEARRAGIKVILTGEGADEIFAGYVGYRFDQLGTRGRSSTACDVNASLDQELQDCIWGDGDFFYEQSFQTLREIKRLFYSAGVNERYEEFDCFKHPLIDKSKIANRHILHKRSYLDWKLRLADHLLSDHGDRMAMARSVEARYPFLDKDVIEFARTMPPEFKLKDLNEKYIVKCVAKDLVPPEIIKRQKFGFHAPASPYLLKQKIDWMNDMLSYDRIKRQGYFSPEFIEILKQQYADPHFRLNIPFENDLLTIVLSFGVFLDVFKLPNFS